MNVAYLSLGSNEGHRIALLKEAIYLLGKHCGQVTAISKVYETAAWGNKDQPDFLNIALEINTELSPLELLSAIHQVEHAMGRERTVKWGQRTLDIDILFYNNEVISEETLTIPHSSLHQRRFVLVPLADIAPNLMHPVLRKIIALLLVECEDELPVRLATEQL